MHLYELFEDDGMSIVDSMKQASIDILTPLLVSKVPFVTVQSVIDSLNAMNTGMFVNRALVMKILDPATVKSVSKIQGDRIYLQTPDDSSEEADQDQTEDDIDKVKQNAIKQAQSKINKPEPPAPKLPNSN